MGGRVLLHPAAPPDARALEAVLGEAAGHWARLVERLDEMGAVGVWAFGGRKYGWELRYKRAGRPFATLTPLDGTFSVLVVLGKAETEVAGGLALHDRVRRLIDSTPQLHDGRWLFIPVESEVDVEDVVTLLLAKLPARVRARISEAATSGVR